MVSESIWILFWSRVKFPLKQWLKKNKKQTDTGCYPVFKRWVWSNGDKNRNKNPNRIQKLTPKKSHAECLGLKNFQKALNDITRKIQTLEIIECLCLFIHHTIWNYHESSKCFEYLKKTCVNQATKKRLAKFSYPKKPRNQKFLTKKSFEHLHHLTNIVYM